MRPKVSRALRESVAELVGSEQFYSDDAWVDVRDTQVLYDEFRSQERERFPTRIESVLPEVLHFRTQTRQLDLESIPQFAVSFRDDGPDGEPLPILVQVPDLQNVKGSYEYLLNSLSKSNHSLEEVDRKSSQEIFVDRLSEFLALQTSAGRGGTPNTVVNSKRHGDTVIHAKGFFVSTGTAFGVSTPAVKCLPSGRYSFGIMDSGKPKFEGIVWTCPAIVKLDLP